MVFRNINTTYLIKMIYLLQNTQKAVRNSIAGSTQEEIEALIEQFERNVIGVLPI